LRDILLITSAKKREIQERGFSEIKTLKPKTNKKKFLMKNYFPTKISSKKFCMNLRNLQSFSF